MRNPHRGRGGSKHVGRLRIRAAKLLSENLGFRVHPEDIVPTTGAYRTNTWFDGYSWEVFSQDANGRPVVFGCWETLTKWLPEASKRGVHINADREIAYNN